MAEYRNYWEDGEDGGLLSQFDPGEIAEAAEGESGGFVGGGEEEDPISSFDPGEIADSGETAGASYGPMEESGGTPVSTTQVRRPVSATPSRPNEPTPMAGTMAPPTGVIPSAPIPDVPDVSMAAPPAAPYNPADSYVGGASLRAPVGVGGLTGGGFSLGSDPVPDETSFPIDTLIALLRGM